jgi:hypothetical protein
MYRTKVLFTNAFEIITFLEVTGDTSKFEIILKFMIQIFLSNKLFKNFYFAGKKFQFLPNKLDLL